MNFKLKQNELILIKFIVQYNLINLNVKSEKDGFYPNYSIYYNFYYTTS